MSCVKVKTSTKHSKFLSQRQIWGKWDILFSGRMVLLTPCPKLVPRFFSPLSVRWSKYKVIPSHSTFSPNLTQHSMFRSEGWYQSPFSLSLGSTTHHSPRVPSPTIPFFYREDASGDLSPIPPRFFGSEGNRMTTRRPVVPLPFSFHSVLFIILSF